jgi:hypothetical protein
MNTLRSVLSTLLISSLTLSNIIGCSTAYADRDLVAARRRVTDPRIAIATAPIKIRAPYDVQVLADDGAALSTYALNNRYYVLGNNGERYTVHVKNPTNRRIEAVITVDGLDVIDGENGDLKKRGYIIQPYGELRVDGYRTSTNEVATFRFSSVDASYAGRKGKARNVGVVAVALFEEDGGVHIAAPIDYLGKDTPVDSDRSDDRGAPPRGSAKADAEESRAPAKAARPPSPSPAQVSRNEAGAVAADRIVAPDGVAPTTTTAPPTNRPGLGTEFGESRYSPTQFTRFMRSTAKPVAIAELRYNDVTGLRALGIDIAPLPSPAEIDTRESADPFPGEASFAKPPR